MPLTADFLRAFMSPCFIETGTYMGAGIQAALKAGFGRIISIDIRQEAIDYAAKALSPLAADPRLSLLCGDSRTVLPEVLRGLDTEATFWLDAHFDFEVGGKNPIEDELAAIAAHPIKTHCILLDDMVPPADEPDRDDRTRRIIAALRAINPDYRIGWAMPSSSWIMMTEL